MKSSFCIDLQRFMLIPTKFPLTRSISFVVAFRCLCRVFCLRLTATCCCFFSLSAWCGCSQLLWRGWSIGLRLGLWGDDKRDNMEQNFNMP